MDVGHEDDDEDTPPDSYLHSLLYDFDWTTALARIAAYPSEARLVGSQNRYPLHAACDSDAPAVVVAALLKEYPEASIIVGTSKMNPLHITCSSQHASVHTIRVLMELGMPEQFRQQDQDGDTPLHMACRCGANVEVLEVLLRAYPDAVHIRDHEGFTPLLRLWVRYFIILGSDVIDGVRTQAELLQGELGQAWAKTESLLRCAYVGTLPAGNGYGNGEPRIFRVVHAVAAVDCPRQVVRLAVTAFPHQLHERDENGKTPLLIAAEADVHEDRDLLGDGDEIEELLYADDEVYRDKEPGPESIKQPSVIEIILEANREEATGFVSAPRTDGRLPLHVAIASGKRWDQGVKALIDVYHAALTISDPLTGLPPFMLAAHTKTCHVDTLYEILRSEPTLLVKIFRRDNSSMQFR